MIGLKERFREIESMGIDKTKYSWIKVTLLGLIGGAAVAIGYLGAIATKSLGAEPYLSIFAAGIFPVGILMVLFLGGSLFTSDALVGLAWMNKKVKTTTVMRNWLLVLLGNLLGALLIALITKWGNFFVGKKLDILAHYLDGKQSIEWYVSIGSGVLCNLLVAGSVWMASASKHSIAKIFLLWFPITLFVLGGFQHIVANFFIFWAGMLHIDEMSNLAHPVTYHGFEFIYNNLLGTCLGNWLAGAIMLPGIYRIIEKYSH